METAPKMPDNPYPAWQQARCIYCAKGYCFRGGGMMKGNTHRLNAGSSDFQYVACTAPSKDEYIAELEREMELVRRVVDEVAGGMERKGRSLHDWLVSALRPFIKSKAKLDSADADLALLRKALITAIIPLEVLAAFIRIKPYQEMSEGFQQRIVDTVATVHKVMCATACLKGAGDDNEQAQDKC